MPAVAYAAVIFAVSSVPGSQVPSVGLDGGDKLLHVAEYGAFGLLLMLAARGLGDKDAVVALVVGVVYAAFDEAHQAFVPGRSADVVDFAVDAAAVLLAVILVVAIRRVRPPDARC